MNETDITARLETLTGQLNSLNQKIDVWQAARDRMDRAADMLVRLAFAMIGAGTIALIITALRLGQP